MEPYDRREELMQFLSIFCSCYNLARAGAFQLLEKEFLSRLYRKGEWFDYIDCRSGEEKKIEARIVGIDSLACLVLQLRDGSTASFSFKELKYII